MISVDVACESENLPRIRLLRAHMRQLQIVLNICEEIPSVHTERIIYVPRRLDSRFSRTTSSPDYERIALYLDERTEPIDAEMKVNLATWPGRSSDKDVAMLAGYLRRPFVKPGPKSEKTKAENTVRRNVAALAGMGLFVAVLIFLANLESEQEQVQDQEQAVNADPPPTSPMTNTTQPQTATIDKDGQSAELTTSSSGTKILRQPLPQSGTRSLAQPRPENLTHAEPQPLPQPLPTEPEPRPRSLATATRQTISPCAGTNDILRGNLVWQVPSDLNPCTSIELF